MEVNKEDNRTLVEIWLKKFTTLRPTDSFDKRQKMFSWNDMMEFAELYSDRNKIST